MYATPNVDEMMNDFASMQQRDARGRLIGDERLLVKFYKKPMHSPLKSEEASRPIYDDLDFILMLVPGDDKLRIDTVATPEHKQRFPTEWKQYTDQGVVIESGTPLEQWGAIPPSAVAEFRHFNINTVEALAELPDGLAQKFVGGAFALRDKAKQWLKANADSAIVARQDTELAKRDVEIAELRKMIEEMAGKPKKAVA